MQGRPAEREATAADVHVVADAFDFGCVGEVACADGFADEVEVLVAGGDVDLLLHEDVSQLRTDFADFPQRLDVDEVLVAPLAAVVVVLPLVEAGEAEATRCRASGGPTRG